MTRIIFAPAALAFLTFCLQPAAAVYYEAPWCAVLGMGKGVYGIANISLSKHVGRMCWRAIVGGAIQTRTLFRMAQHRTHTTKTSRALAAAHSGHKMMLGFLMH